MLALVIASLHPRVEAETGSPEVSAIYTGIVVKGYTADLSKVSAGSSLPFQLYWIKRQPGPIACFACIALLDQERNLVIPVTEAFALADETTAPDSAIVLEATLDIPLLYGSGSYALAIRAAKTQGSACTDQVNDLYWRKLTDLKLAPGVLDATLSETVFRDAVGAGWTRLGKKTVVRNQDTISLPLPAPQTIKQIAVVSALRFGRLIPQGKVVGNIKVVSADGASQDVMLRAGIDTTEGYAHEQVYPPKHRTARQFPKASGEPSQRYYTVREVAVSKAEALIITYPYAEGILVIEDIYVR